MHLRYLQYILKGRRLIFYIVIIIAIIIITCSYITSYFVDGDFALRNSERKAAKTIRPTNVESSQKIVKKIDFRRRSDEDHSYQSSKPNHDDLQVIQDKQIDNISYPHFSSEGVFIPIKRWVHFDLKGAPPKVDYFIEIIQLVKRLDYTGIVIEWEDMFPYNGSLAVATNGNAYSVEEVEKILRVAMENKLEVVPLIQTFSHLEWILKLKKFAHLRDDPLYPQVICIGKDEAWSLLKDMLDQVAAIHKKFDLKYFHIGADEVFEMGFCNETANAILKYNGRERTMLWHISRVAAYVKNKHKVIVQAWYDMIQHVLEEDIYEFGSQDLLEPVLWSYAEDLDQYLPFSSWLALKPFKNVWGASVFKGANGPKAYSSNPIHYIRNHESWSRQMTNVYKEFDYFQGLIFSGWSRYDHFATLCETFPVGIPSLAMSSETILAGRSLGGVYPHSYNLFSCQLPSDVGYAYGCKFPGSRVYELINELEQQRSQLQKFKESSNELNGWLSDVGINYTFSSAMYLNKILPVFDSFLKSLEELHENLITEMSVIFFDDAVQEFVQTYVDKTIQYLVDRKKAALKILSQNNFPRRPIIKEVKHDSKVKDK